MEANERSADRQWSAFVDWLFFPGIVLGSPGNGSPGNGSLGNRSPGEALRGMTLLEYTDEEAPTGRLNCNKNQEIGPGEEIRGDPGVIPGFQLVDCNPS